MYITYKLMGFDDAEENGNDLLLEYAPCETPVYAPYLEVEEQI